MMKDGKKRKILIIFILVSPFVLNAQNVILENEEDYTLNYLIAEALDKSEYKDYLIQNSHELQSIAPQNAFPLISSKKTPCTLLGFYVIPGEEEYPIIAQQISVEAPQNTVSVSLSNSLQLGDSILSFTAWDAPKTNEPIVLDNRFLDWTKVDELSRFSSSYSPIIFTREIEDKRLGIPIEQSFFYKRGGTHIESLKALLSSSYLYIMVSSFSQMQEGLSYFFYLYQDRDSEESNAYTFEIPFSGESGYVVMWEKGKNKPKIVGEYTTNGFYIEARLNLHFFIEEIAAVEKKTASFDFTSSFHASGIYEEFYFTSFYLSDIPSNGAK